MFLHRQFSSRADRQRRHHTRHRSAVHSTTRFIPARAWSATPLRHSSHSSRTARKFLDIWARAVPFIEIAQYLMVGIYPHSDFSLAAVPSRDPHKATHRKSPYVSKRPISFVSSERHLIWRLEDLHRYLISLILRNCRIALYRITYALLSSHSFLHPFLVQYPQSWTSIAHVQPASVHKTSFASPAYPNTSRYLVPFPLARRLSHPLSRPTSDRGRGRL